MDIPSNSVNTIARTKQEKHHKPEEMGDATSTPKRQRVNVDIPSLSNRALGAMCSSASHLDIASRVGPGVEALRAGGFSGQPQAALQRSLEEQAKPMNEIYEQLITALEVELE